MRSPLLATLCLNMIALSCGPARDSESGASETKQIIGTDDRTATTNYSEFIGIILRDGKPICNGWIGARHQVITSAHCQKGNGETLEFVTSHGARVNLAGYTKPRINSEVIQYVAHIGETFLPIAGTHDFKPSAPAKIYSYDLSSNTLVNSAPQGTSEENGLLRYELDTLPGASGSPIIQDGRVVGVHLGYDPACKKNIGVTTFSADASRVPTYQPESSDVGRPDFWGPDSLRIPTPNIPTRILECNLARELYAAAKKLSDACSMNGPVYVKESELTEQCKKLISATEELKKKVVEKCGN
jgi:hypothetical protein